MKDIAPDQSKIAAGSKAGDAGAVADEFGDGEQSVKAGADGTRPRSTVSDAAGLSAAAQWRSCIACTRPHVAAADVLFPHVLVVNAALHAMLQETSDFRSGATDQSPEARFGAPTAIAKKISGQETV